MRVAPKELAQHLARTDPGVGPEGSPRELDQERVARVEPELLRDGHLGRSQGTEPVHAGQARGRGTERRRGALRRSFLRVGEEAAEGQDETERRTLVGVHCSSARRERKVRSAPVIPASWETMNHKQRANVADN